VLAWFAAVSLAGFVGSLIAIPWILVRLRADYFDTRVPRHWMQGRHPVIRGVGLVLKNLVGCVFLFAGIAMLVLPGQGILTILIGVSLLDFPGKQRLEARIVSQRLVLQGINAIREKFGKPPLVLAPEPSPQ
jgi:hypothetical protein